MAKAAAAATDVRQVVLDIARDVAEHRSAQSDAPYQGDEFEVVDDVDCDADERIDLVPLPQVPTRPFRTELTIERNSIFVANSYSEDFFVRETVRTVDGESERVRLIAGKLDERDKEAFGVLTQSHQDAFYELLKLWGDNGYQTVSPAAARAHAPEPRVFEEAHRSSPLSPLPRVFEEAPVAEARPSPSGHPGPRVLGFPGLLRKRRCAPAARRAARMVLVPGY